METKMEMKLTEITFDSQYIYAKDENGNTFKQSLLWYPALMSATDEQRANYTVGFSGFHWRELDEDMSFESFFYADAIPSKLQTFFLVHKEINIAEFANRIGINASLMRNYVNGFKKPSKEREQLITDEIHKLAQEYSAF